MTLLLSRRAVILLEPTNRFRNQLSMNFLASWDGTFVIEILGPGYDAADLNRGEVPPQYIIYGNVGNWSEHRILSIIDVRGTPSDFNETERRRLRLQHLGTHILPGRGVEVKGCPVTFAENWLRHMGYDDLWRPWRFSLDLAQLRHWYDDAFFIANYLSIHGRWSAFVLSWSMLADYRCVYWDIVEATRKFAIPRQ